MSNIYYNPDTKRVAAITALAMEGMPESEPELAALGYFPVEYNYPEVNPGLERYVPDGEIVEIDGHYTQPFKVVPLADDVLRLNLGRLAASKAADARRGADEAVAPYMSEFSDVERQTWAKQQAEVAAYLADNSAPTPTLDGLAKARGISREAMLEKAIAKVTAFEPLSVAIVGKQQKYEDAIRALANDEGKTLQERIIALEAMTFGYAAGGAEIAELA